MYEQVFNLTSRPFTSIHYVKHYFPATATDQALQQTRMIVERGSGPVVIVGDHGTGKTLLLAILEESFKSQFRVVNISASLLRSREDLLQNILFQLQMNCRGLRENEMRLDFVEMLKDERQRGVLLLVDDAQKLTVDSVEEMQLLGDFIHDGQPRIRMVLAGSQGVEERLADTRLASFTQRIAGRFFLNSLNSLEVEQYVRTHVERAGGQPHELFSPESYRAIHEVSEGRPRYINQVCDHAMIFAATRGAVPISDSLVREAWYDIQKLPGAIAPTGSGAAMSDAPASTQTVQTDSDGWTVLEFGDLSESDAESLESVPKDVEVPETIAADAIAEQTTEEGFADRPFVEQPFVEQEFTEQEPDEPSIIDAPTAVGGAAILASAMSGFAVVAAANGSEGSAEPQEFVRETGIENEPPSLVDSDTELDALPAQEFVESVTEYQQQPVEHVQETDQTVTSPATAVFEDPFASDDYENEEVLVDAYSPFVAQQNQRSLEVTSEQLQNLTPGETVQWNESPEPEANSTASREDESFPTFETAMAPPEPVREMQTPERDPRETVETRTENSTLGPNSLSDDFEVNREAGLLSGGPSSTEEEVVSVNLDPIETNPGSGFVPIDPDASRISEVPEAAQVVVATPSDPVTEEVEQETPAAAAAAFVEPTAEETIEEQIAETANPEVPTYEAATYEVVETEAPETEEPISEAHVGITSPNQLDPKFHEQAPSPDDPEIRRQAEEIIRSLGVNPPAQVSHETPTGPLSIQEETSAIEASIQNTVERQPMAASESAALASSPVVMPNLDEIKNALRQAQERQAVSEVPANTQHTPVVTGQIPVQIAGVDPVETEQGILNQVREQVAFTTESLSTQEAPRPDASQPLAGQDDRAILAVSQTQPGDQEVAASETQEAPLPAWSQQEPSQGEAARVDYQRLFDQLRNVQGNQE